jgi:hypothetical protein
LVQVVDVPNPSKTAMALQWSALKNGDAWVALITVRGRQPCLALLAVLADF